MYLVKKETKQKGRIGNTKFCYNKKNKNKACEEDLKSLGPEEAYLSESAFEKLGEGRSLRMKSACKV